MTAPEVERSADGARAVAIVDLDAIAANTRLLVERVAPADVWAVVKANGYGHGAVPVARTVLGAGARGLCVALVDEGCELRAHGISAPILVLSEQAPEQLGALVTANLIATVYRREMVTLLARAVDDSGRHEPLPVHVPLPVHIKVDTGMNRVGAAPSDVASIVDAVRAEPRLALAGIFTHLAVADDPDDNATSAQLDAFDRVLHALDGPLDGIVVHAANSAGALAHPRARRSLVRAGIALYGLSPGAGVDTLAAELRPALSLRSRVGFVKRVDAGERVSYGLRHRFAGATTVATVPIGYADGVPRRLYEVGGCVLIGGRRRPIVGVVTMDQLMVDCDDDPVAIGDEVLLIGEQDGETVTADEWAQRLGTINYEIVCQISARVPRRYLGRYVGGEQLAQ